MRAQDEATYREFVSVRMTQLRRTAYLLCRDWYVADDLVAIALDKLYRAWPNRAEISDLDAYVRVILARTAIDERRRPWRREFATDLDDAELARGSVGGTGDNVADRLTLDGYLAQLGPRRRAVLILRFYCDLSVEETAEALGVSIGTVKSQTARALVTMRALAANESYQ